MATILAALISAVGTLCGALGGIALTSGLESRRQERAAAAAAASAKATARAEARTDLIASVTQLRVLVEMACARHWGDLNVRLGTLEEHAVTVGARASRVAMMATGPEAEAALALGAAASSLSAWAARSAKRLGDYEGPGNQFQPGEIVERPNFTELEKRLAAFLRLISAAPTAADASGGQAGADPKNTR